MFAQSPGMFLDDLCSGVILLALILFILYAIGSAFDAYSKSKDKDK